MEMKTHGEQGEGGQDLFILYEMNSLSDYTFIYHPGQPWRHSFLFTLKTNSTSFVISSNKAYSSTKTMPERRDDLFTFAYMD